MLPFSSTSAIAIASIPYVGWVLPIRLTFPIGPSRYTSSTAGDIIAPVPTSCSPPLALASPEAMKSVIWTRICELPIPPVASSASMIVGVVSNTLRSTASYSVMPSASQDCPGAGFLLQVALSGTAVTMSTRDERSLTVATRSRLGGVNPPGVSLGTTVRLSNVSSFTTLDPTVPSSSDSYCWTLSFTVVSSVPPPLRCANPPVAGFMVTPW